MHLREFLRREARDGWPWILAMAVVAGVSNGAMVGIINAGAAAASAQAVSVFLLLLYALALAIFVVSKRAALDRSTVLVESMVKSARVRVSDKIRRSELVVVEHLGRGEFYPRVTQDTNSISESASILIDAAQQAIMLLFCLLYIAWLSLAALLMTVLLVAIAAYIYQSHRESVQRIYQELTVVEGSLFESLGHLVDGFKELKLNLRRSGSMFRSFEEIADQTERLKTRTGLQFASDMMFSHVFFWLLIGGIVFLLPRAVPTYSAVVIQVTTATMFLVATLLTIVGAEPVFARANSALGNLYALEDKLDRALEEAAVAPEAVRRFEGFTAIAFGRVSFSYTDAAGSPTFTAGPLDLDVRRGEVLFLVGGNGSGKTTVLKLLTGLYLPAAGEIRVDADRIDRSTVVAYRQLFSAVFSEFHLFDRLYGLEDVPAERVEELLREMDLAGKTEYRDGRFTTLELSSGQRKRLALIVALLEDRPVYVFDEWAADQDPRFRRYFYEVILKQLKERGKTVVAVTHDDRYWPYADRLVKMDYGRIVGEGAGEDDAEGPAS